MNKAVFLDRDGTINVEKKYLHKVEDFELIKDVPKAIKSFKKSGFLVVVVTNQAGIGRGLYKEEDVENIHEYLNLELNKFHTQIDAFYYCAHHPEHGVGKYKIVCDCRKPGIGMLKQASIDLDVDLNKSYMIGDNLKDIKAGNLAGCKTILVETGYGANEKNKINKENTPGIIAENLYEASLIIEQNQ
ncbi:MAG: D-glycero-beta-D-manno-heptose 1,7-bisphosphate 7-phosphatase [bacterium]